MSTFLFRGLFAAWVAWFSVFEPLALAAATLELKAPNSGLLNHRHPVLAFDGLGRLCAPEDEIFAAFHLVGKDERPTGSCLPDPCKAALSPQGLADLIGRPASQREWDAYYASYGDSCLAEVIPFEADDRLGGALTGGGAPASTAAPEAFWAPLLSGIPVSSQPARSRADNRPFVPVVPAVSSVFNPDAGRVLSGAGSGAGDTIIAAGGTIGLPSVGNLFDPEAEIPGLDDDATGGTGISSVPLPGSAIVFLSALAGAGVCVARAKRKKNS
jgi:hypothetical protein